MTSTKPGVYDMPADEYHASLALSSSGAKKLMPPSSCPAIFAYERNHGQQRSREFDLGTAAHTLLLGSGPQTYVVDAKNYLTKLAKQERDDAYDRGDIPLLPAEFDTVQKMVAKVRQHPVAGGLFAEGKAEQSLFWTDKATGVECRARPDWLSPEGIVDYKTAERVSLPHVSRAVADYSYYMQADWYLTACVELGLLPPDAPFTFVFQSKTPPYLVTVAELDEEALTIGRQRNERAREIFRDCTESGIWPEFSDDIEVISLPAYEVRRHYQGAFA